MRKVKVRLRLINGKAKNIAISAQAYEYIIREGLKEWIRPRMHKLPSATLPWEAH